METFKYKYRPRFFLSGRGRCYSQYACTERGRLVEGDGALGHCFNLPIWCPNVKKSLFLLSPALFDHTLMAQHKE